MYDYVREHYKVDPRVGNRVRHKELDYEGVITKEQTAFLRSVMVKFGHAVCSVPCHPNALEYK